VQVEAPLDTEYVPVVHGEHTVSPAELANFPARHWVHVAELVIPVPVLYEPDKQAVHVTTPLPSQGP
jgi:hypothetical protein